MILTGYDPVIYLGDNDVVGEEDLMRLQIGGFKNSSGKVKLTVTGGSVKLWEQSDKKTEIPQAGDAVLFDIPGNGINKTLWVEATAPSSVPRDIEIKVGYLDAQGILQDGIDKVRATAVWVIHKETKSAPSDTMWSEASQELRDRAASEEWLPFGSSFDRTIEAGQQTIGFKFEVIPHGIGNESSIRFDVTRQINYQYWVKRSLTGLFEDGGKEPWPPLDQANDDKDQDEQGNAIAANLDEDNDPENNYLFSMDSTSVEFNQTYPEWVAQHNFREFVRVWFHSEDLMGNNSLGSRCSAKYDWQSFFWWVHTPSTQNPRLS